MANLLIGTERAAGGNFKGSLDNVSIWNTALDSSQIQQYMNCPPNGTESGLVGYWNFEEGSGETVLDLSPNGNNGSINGSIYSNDVPEQNCLNSCSAHHVPLNHTTKPNIGVGAYKQRCCPYCSKLDLIYCKNQLLHT